MNSIQGLAYGFSVALLPENLLAALVGALLGTLTGVLPGIGPVGAMALLLSATMAFRPETALIMMAGVYYGSQYGWSTTSILINVPGELASVVSCVDGYQMAKKGKAGVALAVAAVGSFIAGTLGVVGLVLFAPTLANFALSFGPPEYFSICLLALFTLSMIFGGSFWKGLAILGFGFALATTGMEPISGFPRYTFGIIKLMEGVKLVPVAVGLFGLAEVLLVAEQAGGLPHIPKVRFRDLFPSLKEWKQALPAIFRGGLLGFFMGLLPGPSNVICTFASYGLERRISKHPEEFGRGAIEGLAGPESANNAATSGALIPLLALGLPFSASTAMLLAGLAIQGVTPGPLLISQYPQIFWGTVASMYIGNVALLVLNLPLVGMWVSVLRIPQSILLALIMVFMTAGVYSINNSNVDLVVFVVMGIMGYVLRKLNFNVMPMVLALVLGEIMEKTFVQSMNIGRGDLLIFFRRPISGICMVLLVFTLVAPTVWRLAVSHRKGSV